MNRTPVLLVLGTRPEAIKLAPLFFSLSTSKSLRPELCVTAQHREMLDEVLRIFDIKPHHDLDVMRPNQTLATLSARILQGLDDVILATRPAAVIVQGDTTTTFCGALAAFYRQIPIAHIEAGLRTGNRYSPFPEEINRVLTTRLANWHFAATLNNQQTLIHEGVPASSIHTVGNTGIDALLLMRERILQGRISAATNDLIQSHQQQRYILVTTHRRENFGDKLTSICQAILALANQTDIEFVFPVHRNPHVQTIVRQQLAHHPRIKLLPPLNYEAFVALMIGAYAILTDSGGIQEEAPTLGIPVLVLRESTERDESAASSALMVGTDPTTIVSTTSRLINHPAYRAELAQPSNAYGDGHAAQRITKILQRELIDNDLRSSLSKSSS